MVLHLLQQRGPVTLVNCCTLSDGRFAKTVVAYNKVPTWINHLLAIKQSPEMRFFKIINVC